MQRLTRPTALLLCVTCTLANVQAAQSTVTTTLPVTIDGEFVANQLFDCQGSEGLQAVKVTDPKIHDRDYGRLSDAERGGAQRGIENGKQCQLGTNAGLEVRLVSDPTDRTAVVCAQGGTAEFYEDGFLRSCLLGVGAPQGIRQGTSVLTGDDGRGHECQWGTTLYFNKDGSLNLRWTNRAASPACR